MTEQSTPDLIEELRWQKRYTNGRVPYTMERAAEEIERLRAALQSIADKCPATCDMTLAHEMAEDAETALQGVGK